MRGVAPCLVGAAVALDNETVEVEVHGLLAERSDEFALTADMAGVAQERQVGITAAQLEGDMPLG